MACKLYIIILFIVLLTQYAVEGKNKTKKAVEAKKAKDTSRSANPGREKGAFQKLSVLMNKTDDRRLSTKEKISKINEINRHKDIHAMLNDNQGDGIMSKQKYAEQENITTSFVDKMSILRQNGHPSSYVMESGLTIPHAVGVYCDFEKSHLDLCQWQWNETVTREGHGFNIMSPGDVIKLNDTDKRRYSGPLADADGNTEGHFLYLPVDGSMGNMVIKSPPFRGLGEFCNFEASLHQHGMQSSIIRLISETVHSQVQWILQEVLGNNDDIWRPIRFMVGKVQQDIRIMLEVSPLTTSGGLYPHVAVDNIRMVDCVPEPPVFDGQCHKDMMKCDIMNRESCIKKQQICDLVGDCDDGVDEKTLCYKMPFGSYCDFEVDSCGFTNVPQPILKWSRHSGPTPTDKTGPPADHTCGPPSTLSLPPLSLPPLSPPYPPAPLAPPLAPPPCRGYYLYVNMNVTGPNNQRADFASTAVMNSVLFNPPPRVHGNITSSYYNCCMIRFYYHQNGKNFGSLSVDLVEMKLRGNISTSLWFSTKDKGEHWYRANIFLPNVTSRYFLQFKTRMGMRIYSDSAIDDFSLSPECFGINIDPAQLGDYDYNNPTLDEDILPHPDFENSKVYRFSSCGASGRFGPNQTMCDIAYNNTGYKVDVLDRDNMKGVQVFTVPEDGYYTIIAEGAAGGSEGVMGSAGGAGWGARGVTSLRGGDTLYILVGHKGGDACTKSLGGASSCFGSGGANVSAVYTSRTQEVRNTRVREGGGGGGGGSFVFQVEGTTWYPVVVGGGGGTGGGGGGLFPHPPSHTHMYGDPGTTPGAGGGWLESGDGARYPTRGRGALEGAVGGAGCGAGDGDGGYGGGGGGCGGHGGGGGYNGGVAGAAGGSYSRGPEGAAETHHRHHGDVTIIPATKGCGCSYLCVALDVWRMSVRCVCPERQVPHPANPHVCVAEVWWEDFSFVVTTVMAAILVVFVGATGCLGLYLYNKYQLKKEAAARRKQLLEQEVQLHRLRNPPGGDSLAAFNPHYGSEAFVTSHGGVDISGLPQVARDTLKLVKALGQGAFGEVYQGVYHHKPGDADMQVAVKTLPELSTGQAEADFLMEAAIMAKFNHPNVVHLIGVCFDRHPRFIVLELLAGGDLKNFLRESRPRPERASPISMQDLLQCGLDVAKGCRYLETKRFIHRDIAARNCLLTSRGPGRVVKIADFGMARDVYRSDYYRKGGKALLPIKWMPPEAYVDGIFTVNSDVWAYGVLLWEVLSLGVMPYTGCSNREVMDLVGGGGRLERPYNECPPELYRLMCECWNPVPDQRPTFTQIYDRLYLFMQDPEILNTPLPTMRIALAPIEDKTLTNGPQSMAGCDYLVPLSNRDSTVLTSSTDTLVPHSGSPTTPDNPHLSDPPLQTASQEYGSTRGGAVSGGRESGTSVSNNNKFLSSKSTDRLVSSTEDASIESEGSGSEEGEGGGGGEGRMKETSFSSRPPPLQDVTPNTDAAVEKLISITPTSPRPPPTPLSLPVSAKAPIASPDPPRILPRKPQEPRENRPRPLCLDAAQLEHNLNALKKKSGSVNLNTMNIVPPHINVVTPNKLAEKTIQIDPKKAVIYDLQSPGENVTQNKLKQSNSTASLLNGPMTDVPYADSDNASSSSSSNGPNQIGNIKLSKPNDYEYIEVKIRKESVNDSEISC